MEDLADKIKKTSWELGCYIWGIKGIYAMDCFRHQEFRDWGGREGGRAAPVCGEGRWVRMRPRSGLPLK